MLSQEPTFIPKQLAIDNESISKKSIFLSQFVAGRLNFEVTMKGSIILLLISKGNFKRNL